MVTPCMGVWIETETRKAWEPPTLVTPCMGVWIETQQMDINAQKGVWIETACQVLKVYESLGHTLYGCVDSIEDL